MSVSGTDPETSTVVVLISVIKAGRALRRIVGATVSRVIGASVFVARLPAESTVVSAKALGPSTRGTTMENDPSALTVVGTPFNQTAVTRSLTVPEIVVRTWFVGV